MRRVVVALLAGAVLAGCGAGAAPEPVAQPDDLATAVGLTPGGDLRVRTRGQFAAGSWTAPSGGGRMFTAAHAGRERGRTRTFVLRTDAPVDGPVTLTVRTYVPGVRDTVLVADATRGRLRDLQPAPAGTPAPALDVSEPAAPTVSGRTWVVQAGGSDTAAGGPDAPLATVDAALRQAKGGDEIVVGDGTYPPLVDTEKRTTPLLIRAAAGARPRFQGASLRGTGLRVSGLRFTESVSIGQPRVGGAADIELRDTEIISETGAYCLRYRGGTTALRVLYSHLHDCEYGVQGVPHEAPSRQILLHGNLIERVKGDGMQIANTRDLTIDRNVVRDLGTPGEPIHNDGVQLFGSSRRVRITRNIFTRTDDQLILLQNRTPQPNVDVRVEDNLLVDTPGVAIQSFGTQRLRVERNTAWGNRWGGLLIGGGVAPGTGGPPSTDGIVAGNVLDGLILRPGGKIARQTANRVAATPPVRRRLAARLFRDSRAGDYAPRRPAPASGPAATYDLYGVPRGARPTPGALQ